MSDLNIKLLEFGMSHKNGTLCEVIEEAVRAEFLDGWEMSGNLVYCPCPESDGKVIVCLVQKDGV